VRGAIPFFSIHSLSRKGNNMFISQQYLPRDVHNHFIHDGISWQFRLFSWCKARRYDDVRAFYNL
jgi:hypothetical protein